MPNPIPFLANLNAMYDLYDRYSSRNKRARDAAGSGSNKKIKNGDPFKDIGAQTLVSGEKQYPPLTVPRNIFGESSSKSVSETLDAFLKMNTGVGKTRQQFNFRISSEVNKRHWHWQLYRHRCAANSANIENEPYPDNFNVLNTQVDVKNVTVTSGGVNTNVATVTNPYQEVVRGRAYISEMSRTDMEDMSWNLNRGKKHLTALNNVVPEQLGLGHRKQSSLQCNNNYFISPTLMMNNAEQNLPTNVDVNQFNYKANFFGGDLEYNFANKFNSGAHIEIVLFKVKKNTNFSPFGDDTAALDNALVNDRNPYKQFTDRICEGFVKKRRQVIGTDDFGGDDELGAKTLNDPSSPFLQKTTFTPALPFKEVYREKFALCAGGRKQVKIHLPGVCYDPTKILYCDTGALSFFQPEPPNDVYPGVVQPTGATVDINTSTYNDVNGYSWDPNNSMIKAADQYSYTVCIACHGERLSLIVDPALSFGEQSIHVAGDAYAKSDIMVQAQYTERIGACVYADDEKAKIYTNGIVKKPTVDVLTQGENKLASVSTGHIIPLTRSVLVSSTKTTTVGNNQSTVGTGVSGNPHRSEL